MAGSIRAGDPGTIQDDGDSLLMQADIHEQLVEGSVEEGRVQRNDGVQTGGGHTCRNGECVLLGDTDVHDAIGVSGSEWRQTHRIEHCRSDPEDVGAFLTDLHHARGERTAPGVCTGPTQGLSGGGIDLADRVEGVLLVVLGCCEALALDGDGMDDDGTAKPFGKLEGTFQVGHVVTVDRPQILDPEVGEDSRPTDQDVLDASLDTVHEPVDLLAQGGTGHGLLHAHQGVLVVRVGTDGRESIGQTAHRWGVGASVVVDDDDEWEVWLGGNGIECLPRHTAGECPVSDDSHHGAIVMSLTLEGLGHPLGP